MTRTRLSGTLAPWSIAALALLLVAGATVEFHAQSQSKSYYGKNRVKYDHFDWHIYTTDHFEIYYYPELEEHLERVRQLRGECLRQDQRRSAARPGREGPLGRVQDAQRVRAAEYHPERHPRRSAGVCRAAARPDGAPD